MRGLKIALVLVLLYTFWMIGLKLVGMFNEDRVWVYILGLPFLISPGFLITQLTSLSSMDMSVLGSNNDLDLLVIIHTINGLFLVLLGILIDKLLKIRKHWHEVRPY